VQIITSYCTCRVCRLRHISLQTGTDSHAHKEKHEHIGFTSYNLASIERVQSLAYISRSAPNARVCCHSNETRAPITNPTKSAQLEGTLYHFSKLHPGPCSIVGMWRKTDRQTDANGPLYITLRLCLTRNVNI